MNKALSGLIAAFCIWMLAWTGNAHAAGLEDGTYTGDYLILQADNDSVSMANDYWEKPASIVIKDGKATVRVTINHSFWVTQFKVPGGGGYVDTKVISSNKKADTRLVEFTADITKPIASKIHVTVADIDYDHDYTIRFAFDESSFKLVKKADSAPSAAPSAKPTEKPTMTPTPTPAATEKPVQSSKPSASALPEDHTVVTGTTKPAAQGGNKPTEDPAKGTGQEQAAVESTTSTPSPSPAASAETSVEEQPAASEEDAIANTGTADPVSEASSGEAGGTELAAAAQEDTPALSAGEVQKDAGGSGNWVWWLITGIVIVGAGVMVIWRRKAR
ncbi:NEAr transporter [Paenibacillus sp. JDR-2]|nr:NEAr transporter [Paenibacillus sp. JDR-2]